MPSSRRLLTVVLLAALVSVLPSHSHAPQSAIAGPPPAAPSSPRHSDSGAASLTATITGPTQVAPGDLCVLTLETDAEAQAVWFLGNSDKTFLPVDNGRRVVFSSGQSGQFRFLVAVFKAGEQPASASHTVTVGQGPLPPGPGPDPGPSPPGPGPNPPDPPQPDSKLKAALDAVSSPTKPDDAKHLSGAYANISSQVAAGGMTTEEEMLSEMISAHQKLGAASRHWFEFAKVLGGILDSKDGLKAKGEVFESASKLLGQ